MSQTKTVMPEPPLSPTEREIRDIARRHGFSAAAAAVLLRSLAMSGGGMAQFSHPELGGRGQWMSGGMTMIADLSDPSLKPRVAALCAELAVLIVGHPPAGSHRRLA